MTAMSITTTFSDVSPTAQVFHITTINTSSLLLFLIWNINEKPHVLQSTTLLLWLCLCKTKLSRISIQHYMGHFSVIYSTKPSQMKKSAKHLQWPIIQMCNSDVPKRGVQGVIRDVSRTECPKKSFLCGRNHLFSQCSSYIYYVSFSS